MFQCIMHIITIIQSKLYRGCWVRFLNNCALVASNYVLKWKQFVSRSDITR